MTAAVAVWAAGSFQLGPAAAVAAVAALGRRWAAWRSTASFSTMPPSWCEAAPSQRYETVFQLAWVGGGGLATVVPFGAVGGLMTLAAIALGGIIATV